MEYKNRRAIVGAVSALLLFVLACGVGRPPTQIPTAVPKEGGVGPTETPPPTAAPVVPTEAPSPANTTAPDESGGDCTYDADFVQDVTVPDNTEFSPGASFVKVWRMENTGTCLWQAGTKLAFISGDPIGGPPEVAVGPVALGATTDISASFVAPGTPGTYQANYQMQNHEGVHFGTAIHVQIVVPAPATSTPKPTAQPTAQPTSECVAIDSRLQSIANHADIKGYDMGCATGAAFFVETNGDRGALQEYWANVDDPNPHTHLRSLMIWRSDNREIYVIIGKNTDASEGTLLAYTDFWEESQPAVHPNCAGMTVPSGYELPVRGFGKIWCENNLVDQIGWPADSEEAADILVQPTQRGLLMKVASPVRAYLIAMHYQAVYAVTQFTSP
jgi:hypothetical protein